MPEVTFRTPTCRAYTRPCPSTEVIDACVEGIPFVPLDEAKMQARGLGSMVAFWERMRNICPKVNLYHGPIYGKGALYIQRECLVPHGGPRSCQGVSPGVLTALLNAALSVDSMSSVSV